MKTSPRLLCIAALLVLAIAASAIARGPAPVGNFITLHLGPNVGEFRGKVKSDVKPCIAHRKVRVVLIQGPSVGPDMRVAKGYTDGKGRYDIQTDQRAGTWITKVKKERVKPGLVCAGAESKRRAAG
jgi:hypothetical protein